MIILRVSAHMYTIRMQDDDIGKTMLNEVQVARRNQALMGQRQPGLDHDVTQYNV